MSKDSVATGMAGVLVFALLLGALSGKHIAYDDSAYNIENDAFKPFMDYNPNTQTGACFDSSLQPCNPYDFYNATIPLAGDCVGTGVGDTDGDGYDAIDWPSQLIPDPSCVVREDWNQDGFCDHRVFDQSRSQSDTEYEAVTTYHSYLGGGTWERLTAPTPCTGWLVVP